MSQQTVAEIKQYLKENKVSSQKLTELKQDMRKGVQLAIKQYERRLQKQRAMELAFQEMMVYEQAQYEQGKMYIAGIDEVGRGPLAGPVVAAAVILPKDFQLLGMTDSKQLSKAKREYYYEQIKKEAIAYTIGVINNDEIDQINIYQASIKAMEHAVQKLDPAPDHLLIDAVKLPGVTCSSESIVKGDQKSLSIAAASIIAKVTRDQMMTKLHKELPAYQFNKNQGYGTREHLDALKQFGPSPYHRKSFAPVKESS